MKITMYELLGLIKDGKAPKKISYNDIEIEYNKDTKDYYPYYDKYLFEHKFEDCVDFLEDEVEIIEEPKKIKRLDIDFKKIDDEIVYLEFESKINEIIDEINNLKDND